MRRAFFISPVVSWVIMASACLMSLGGCVTTRQCRVQTQAAEARGEGTVRYLAMVEQSRSDLVWTEMYCKMVLAEEIRYAYATKNATMQVPAVCSKFMTSKGWHKK